MPNLPVVTKAPVKRKLRLAPAAVTQAVKTEVAKQIAKKSENKLIMQVGLANTNISADYPLEYVTPQIAGLSAFRPILPGMVAGTDANQRIGLNITPKALKLKGTISFAYDLLYSSDYCLRLMVLTNKSQKSMPALVANAASVYSDTLMWDGQTANGISYSGCQPYFNMLPINNKCWNILEDRLVHMRKGLGGGQSIAPPYDGEVFMSPTRSFNFEIVLTQKDMPATLKFNADTDAYPTNFAPVLALGWVDQTGGIPVSTGGAHQKDVLIEWTSYLIYED